MEGVALVGKKMETVQEEGFFAHRAALVESERIGSGTRIWAFAHVLPGAVIGRDCNICDHVFIENDVVLGDRVTIKCGVQLWDGLTLEDDVFVGPNATFTNDPFPRSKQPFALGRTVVRKGASIGANATLLPGITIGANAMVGAGAVVTKDVPRNAIIVGNPAGIVGYVDTPRNDNAEPVVADNRAGVRPLSVKGTALHTMPLIQDLRGALTFSEFGQGLPFVPQRYFLILDVPNKEVRGEHAHKTLHEFLVCVQGSCAVTLDDGTSKVEVVLDSPTRGLHIPPMVWCVQYKYSSDAVLMVLASDVYKPEDYIRSYDEFLELRNEVSHAE